MSGEYLGDFPTGQTIYVYFNTFDSNDPSASVTITGLALADIKIYKNGSVTERASTSGFTLLDTDGTDFDGITGIHGFSIDTSDNTDAGFFAAGNDYTIVVSSITVDAATINFIAARFSIDNRGLLRPTTAQRTLDVTATGAAGVDWGNVENQGTSVDLSATVINLCDTVTDVTNQVTAAAMADAVWDEVTSGHLTAGTTGLYLALAGAVLQDTTITGTPSSTTFQLTAGSTTDDFYNDQLIYILSGTGVGQVRPILDYTGATRTVTIDEAWITTPAASDRVAILSTHVHPITQIADNVWDEATSGHASAGTTGKALTDILADTNEIQADWVDGGRLDLIIDELTSQGDTNETLISALNNITVADILTTQMTESYASDGSAPTLAQALFAIQQFLQERNVSGTTLTVRKIDGVTSAMTFTLDDGTSPTDITRAT